MTGIEKKLRFWIIDDLKERRLEFESIIKKIEPDAEIVKIPHPLKLKLVLSKFVDLDSKINLFFSDFNMKWSNVEWDNTNDTENQDVNFEEGYCNFPGTQKVLKEARSSEPKLSKFLLLMLSTMVVRKGSILAPGEFKETLENEWTYEEMGFNTVAPSSIHKISKPFDKAAYDRVLEHIVSLMI